MSGFDDVQIVALVGWLVVAIGAFASYQMSWKKGLQLALIWILIFLSVTVAISFLTA